jgi:hypothetical protein
MTRARWIVAGVCAVLVALTSVGFDALGGDCGDAVQAGGSESFECNTTAYVLLAAGAIGCVGLLGVGLWAAVDRTIARRRGRPKG